MQSLKTLEAAIVCERLDKMAHIIDSHLRCNLGDWKV